MPRIQILFTPIVVGVLLWLVNRFIPMAGSIKSIFERSRGHRRGAVAPECVWTVSFPLADSRSLKNGLSCTREKEAIAPQGARWRPTLAGGR